MNRRRGVMELISSTSQMLSVCLPAFVVVGAAMLPALGGAAITNANPSRNSRSRRYLQGSAIS